MDLNNYLPFNKLCIEYCGSFFQKRRRVCTLIFVFVLFLLSCDIVLLKFNQWRPDYRPIFRSEASIFSNLAFKPVNSFSIFPTRSNRRKLQTTEISSEIRAIGSLYDSTKERSYHEQGLFSWNSDPEKYILLVCLYGKVSNRIICIRHHLLLAGLSNRTLIIPFSRKEVARKFERQIFLDINYLRSCYGKRQIITTGEYFHTHKTRVRINHVFCLGHTGCNWKMIKELRRTVIFDPNARTNSAEWLKKSNLSEVINTFANLNQRVVLLGDLYYFFALDSLPEIMKGGDLPFLRSNTCPLGLVIRPHRAIFEAARTYIDRVINGQKFVGVHLRRGDFKNYCQMVKVGCYYPIDQIAQCILDKLNRTNTGNLFIASNGDLFELQRLKQLLHAHSKRNLSIFEMPKVLNEEEAWTIPLVEAKFSQPALAMLELDKLICAYSEIFLGSVRSSFTGDIQRLRYGLNTSDYRDSYICDVYSSNSE